MIHFLFVLTVARATVAEPSSPDAHRSRVSAMISASARFWPDHLRTVQAGPRDARFWAGALGAIAADGRRYERDDLRAGLLGLLRTDVRDPARRADLACPECSPQLHAALIKMLNDYGSRHRQRDVLLEVLCALELWSAEDALLLTRNFFQLSYPHLALPWIKMVRTAGDVARPVLNVEMGRLKTHEISLTPIAAAYRARFPLDADGIYTLLTQYPPDANSENLRSTRRAYRTLRATDPGTAERYRAEANQLLFETYSRVRRRLRQHHEFEEEALERARASSLNDARPLRRHNPELRRLIEWLTAEHVDPKFFDVATSPCSESLFSRSAP